MSYKTLTSFYESTGNVKVGYWSKQKIQLHRVAALLPPWREPQPPQQWSN